MPKQRCAPIAAAALAFALAGCEPPPTRVEVCPAGQVGTPPNCSTPCTQSAVYNNSGAVPSLVLIFDDFPVTESGRLDLTLEWTNASSQMGLYLVPAGTCTLDQFNQRTCNFLVRSDPARPQAEEGLGREPGGRQLPLHRGELRQRGRVGRAPGRSLQGHLPRRLEHSPVGRVRERRRVHGGPRRAQVIRARTTLMDVSSPMTVTIWRSA